MSYETTRDRVETYFDRTATRTWEALTSDAPVSRVRETVRKGREEMGRLLLSHLPDDLLGAHILDAGCGTGTLAIELAKRGATVVGVDISPKLVSIAEERTPEPLKSRVRYKVGDLASPGLGAFDHIVAMDSLIYYDRAALETLLGSFAPRVSGQVLFTVAPSTGLLTAMYYVGKLFPRSDRSPAIRPQKPGRIQPVQGQITSLGRVKSGFYISEAMEFAP